MSTTYYGTEITVQLTPLTCGARGCGVPFAITNDLYRKASADHSIGFWCPNGHKVYFQGKSTEDQLRDAEAGKVALRDQLEAAAREAESVRGALLRDRHRFANGVCPCCNRSFENVRRHMTTKHPDYDVTKIHQRTPPRFPCSCGRDFGTLAGLHRHQSVNRSDDWYAPGRTWGAHLTKV